MNTKQKKILLGTIIVALILVATIVVVVVVVFKNGNLTPTMTEDEMLAEINKLVKADEHTHLIVQVRVALKDGEEHDGKIVHDFRKAKEYAIKQVEIRGSNDENLFDGGEKEDQFKQKIASMSLIGQRMVIGNPIFKQVKGAAVLPGKGPLADLMEILKVDDVTFNVKLAGGNPLQNRDGDDMVYYFVKKIKK